MYCIQLRQVTHIWAELARVIVAPLFYLMYYGIMVVDVMAVCTYLGQGS